MGSNLVSRELRMVVELVALDQVMMKTHPQDQLILVVAVEDGEALLMLVVPDHTVVMEELAQLPMMVLVVAVAVQEVMVLTVVMILIQEVLVMAVPV